MKHLKEYNIPTSAAARACLEIAGGGLTTYQTAKAMEWQRTLLETGELKAGGYHLKLKDFKVPDSGTEKVTTMSEVLDRTKTTVKFTEGPKRFTLEGEPNVIPD